MLRLRKPLLAGIASLVLVFSCSCKHAPAGGHPTETATSSGGAAATSAGSSQSVAKPVTGGRPGSFRLQDRATQFDVTYTPETVQLSKQAVKDALLSVSEDGATYTFDSSSGDAKKLKAGSVMLLSGIALRKVTSVSETARGIVVQTDMAAITDAISDGTIAATVPVDFGSMQTAENALPPAPRHSWSLLPPVYAQGGGGGSVTTENFGIGPQKLTFQMEPFVYNITFTPAAGQMNIVMTVTDTTANLGFTATGYLKNFDSLMNMVISGSKVTKYTFQNSGIEGDMVVTWSAASQVAGPMNKIGSWTENLKNHPALKGLAFYVPFYVGAIPFTMKFTGGITFVPAFTSKNTVMDGQLHVHYSGSAGFNVDHGAASGTGTIAQPTQANPTSNIVSLGPIGFTVAVEFPRVELGLGINLWASAAAPMSFGFQSFSPTAYVNTVSAFGIVYGGPAAMLPCETHILAVSVNTGITASSTVLSFLGPATKLTFEKQIYKKMYTGPKQGMMLCPK